MKPIDKDKLHGELIRILSDGFNRALGALVDAKAIKPTPRFKSQYRGVGSPCYDLVTEQLEYTAKYAAESLVEFFDQFQVEPERSDGPGSAD